MVIHPGRILSPMNAAAFDDNAMMFARAIEDAEAKRRGMKVKEVRPIVARTIGIPAGTLENLRRARVKGVRAFVFDRLREAYHAELQRQMRHLSDEIERTKPITGPDHSAVRAAEAVRGKSGGED